jgi:hypothetical protein
MFYRINNFTPPTPIIDGVSNKIEGSDVNNLFTPTNGINDTLTSLAGKSWLTINSNTTIPSNTNVVYFCNAASSSFTVTLPAAINQRFTIFIKKIDSSNNTVTISTSGSDTIEQPNLPQVTPTASNLVLRSPDEAVVLVPINNTWRLMRYFNNRSSFHAIRTGSVQNITQANGVTVVQFNTIEFQTSSGLYNTGNGQFTCIVPGVYMFGANVVIESGTPTDASLFLFRNNGVAKYMYYQTSTGNNQYLSGAPVMIALTNGDTVDVRVQIFAGGVSRNISSALGATYFWGVHTGVF